MGASVLGAMDGVVMSKSSFSVVVVAMFVFDDQRVRPTRASCGLNAH
ncbi:MAG: hypothetical protein AAFU85_07320 [Planctomycetota bacterium]